MQPKILGQLRPSSTSAEVLFTVARRAEVSTIVVTNTTAGTLTFSIFVDLAGSSATDDEALFKGTTLKGNETVVIDFDESPMPLLVPNSTVSVQASSASSLTFTAWGQEDL